MKQFLILLSAILMSMTELAFAQSSTPEESLVQASCKGDLDKVNNFLQYRVLDINHKDANGNSALSCAASHRYEAILIALLDQTYFSVDINITDRDGKTLFFHLENQDLSEDVQRVLLKHLDRANLETLDLTGNAILHYPFKSKTVSPWLPYVKNFSLKNKNGKTPLEASLNNSFGGRNSDEFNLLLGLPGVDVQVLVQTAGSQGLVPYIVIEYPDLYPSLTAHLNRFSSADLGIDGLDQDGSNLMIRLFNRWHQKGDFEGQYRILSTLNFGTATLLKANSSNQVYCALLPIGEQDKTGYADKIWALLNQKGAISADCQKNYDLSLKMGRSTALVASLFEPGDSIKSFFDEDQQVIYTLTNDRQIAAYRWDGRLFSLVVRKPFAPTGISSYPTDIYRDGDGFSFYSFAQWPDGNLQKGAIQKISFDQSLQTVRVTEISRSEMTYNGGWTAGLHQSGNAIIVLDNTNPSGPMAIVDLVNIDNPSYQYSESFKKAFGEMLTTSNTQLNSTIFLAKSGASFEVSRPNYSRQVVSASFDGTKFNYNESYGGNLFEYRDSYQNGFVYNPKIGKITIAENGGLAIEKVNLPSDFLSNNFVEGSHYNGFLLDGKTVYALDSQTPNLLVISSSPAVNTTVFRYLPPATQGFYMDLKKMVNLSGYGKVLVATIRAADYSKTGILFYQIYPNQ